MNGLARVYLFNVLVTAGGLCAPFFLYPRVVAEALASPTEATVLVIRLLAVAWAGLCVGYAFAFGAALRGDRRPGMLWAGVAANGGTCFLLGATIVTGAWEPWDATVRWTLLAAAVVTAAITGALLWYGLLFDRVFGGRQATSAPTPAPAPAATPKVEATPPKPSLLDAAAGPAARATATAEATAGAGAPASDGKAKTKPKAEKKGGSLLGRLRGGKKEAQPAAKPSPEPKK